MDARSDRSQAAAGAATVLVAIVLILGGISTLVASGHRPAAAAAGVPAAPAPVVTTTTVPATTTTVLAPARPTGGSTRPACIAPPTVLVPNQTDVAHLAGNTPGSDQPGATPHEIVPGAWYGYPSALPIVATQPGWLEVRKAQRPNQSTAWIPTSAATITTTPYAMVLNLCDAHLMVFENGQKIHEFPAGIGAPDDPTVTGQYFVAMTTPPPNPGYGPFVLATSAHSDAIQSWEGMGDAIIAIHGPITSYDDGLIGTTGAAISHGCVRLHDSDLAELSVIPAGTPLQIIG